MHARDRRNWPAGVKAVYGFPRGTRREAGRGASEIQSLLFEKSKWTPSKAKDWLAARGFLYGKMDPGGERADYYHFRQTSPGGFARMRVSTNPERTLYRETVIKRHHAGFGFWESYSNAEFEWKDDEDLLQEIAQNIEGEIYELNFDKLPREVDNISGRIHNEPTRVFAVIEDNGDVRYFGIEASYERGRE